MLNENKLKQASHKLLITDTLIMFIIFIIFSGLFNVIAKQVMTIDSMWLINALIYAILFIVVNRWVQRKNYDYHVISVSDPTKVQAIHNYLKTKKASEIQQNKHVIYYSLKNKYFLKKVQIIIKQNNPSSLQLIAPKGVITDIEGKMDIELYEA